MCKIGVERSLTNYGAVFNNTRIIELLEPRRVAEQDRLPVVQAILPRKVERIGHAARVMLAAGDPMVKHHHPPPRAPIGHR